MIIILFDSQWQLQPPPPPPTPGKEEGRREIERLGVVREGQDVFAIIQKGCPLDVVLTIAQSDNLIRM